MKNERNAEGAKHRRTARTPSSSAFALRARCLSIAPPPQCTPSFVMNAFVCLCVCCMPESPHTETTNCKQFFFFVAFAFRGHCFIHGFIPLHFYYKLAVGAATLCAGTYTRVPTGTIWPHVSFFSFFPSAVLFYSFSTFAILFCCKTIIISSSFVLQYCNGTMYICIVVCFCVSLSLSLCI